jgi:hypothetical protein
VTTETAHTIGVLAEAVGAAGLATLVAFTAASYGHVPARIAIQFDLTGAPMRSAGRGALLMIPAAGAGFLILMSFLNPAVSFPGGTAQDVSKAPVLLQVIFAESLWLLFAVQWTIVRAAAGARPNMVAIIAGTALMAASIVGLVAMMATRGDGL